MIVGIQAERGIDQCGRQVDVRIGQQTHDVRRPAHRHGGGRNRVLEQQVPADEPGERLAERGVGIAVRAARHRQEGCELRIAQRRKASAEGGDRSEIVMAGPE